MRCRTALTVENTRSASTLVRRTGAGLVAAGLVAAGSPARAQVTSESFLRNHGTLPTYQTTYTPGTGQDRVVVVIVASEYDLNRQDNGQSVPNESVASSVTLGGVPLRSFAPSTALVGAPPTSRENARNKRNRLSLFYLPEAELPGGASTFSIAYTQPASSMIYIATALNIRQDDPISPPVFEVNCRGAGLAERRLAPRTDRLRADHRRPVGQGSVLGRHR